MKNGSYILVIAPSGYPGKRYRGRYCYEHHLVWWQNTGEVPGPGWLVHHKDEIKINNEFSNLEKKTVAAHSRDHRPAPEIMVILCYQCRRPYEMLASAFRSRSKEYGHTDFCCSRSCQVRKQHRDRYSGVAQQQSNRLLTDVS